MHTAPGEVTAGLAESIAAYRRVISSVTCGMTAEDRDQLRNHTFMLSMDDVNIRYEYAEKTSIKHSIQAELG